MNFNAFVHGFAHEITFVQMVKGDELTDSTLTREQAALKSWCDKLHALVDFTSDTTAIVYWRMAGRWRIGEIEYVLSGDRWCTHIDRVHKVYVNQEITNGN